MTTTGMDLLKGGPGLAAQSREAYGPLEDQPSLWPLFLAAWGILVIAGLVLIRIGVHWGIPVLMIIPITLAGCAWKPIFGLTLMAAAEPLAADISIGGYFSVSQGVGIMFGVGALANMVVTRKKSRLINTMTLATFGLALLALLSVQWATHPPYAMANIRTPIQMFAYVLLIVSVVRRPADLLWPLRIYVAACVVAFVLVWHAGFRLEMSRVVLAYGGVGDVNPGRFGAVMALGFLTAIYLYPQTRTKRFRPLLVASMATCLAGTMLTGGRASVFALVPPLFLPLLSHRVLLHRPRVVVGVLIAVGLVAAASYFIALYVLPAKTTTRLIDFGYAASTFDRRMAYIVDAVSYVSRHPLGAGWACFRSGAAVVHNDVMYVFANLGIPGFLLFTGFAIGILYLVGRMSPGLAKWYAVGIVVYLLLTGLAAVQLFQKVYWMFLAIAWLLAYFDRTQEPALQSMDGRAHSTQGPATADLLPPAARTAPATNTV